VSNDSEEEKEELSKHAPSMHVISLVAYITKESRRVFTSRHFGTGLEEKIDCQNFSRDFLGEHCPLPLQSLRLATI
jgi:hypothetical protein